MPTLTLLLLALLLAPAPLRAAILEPRAVQVLDIVGVPRQTFTDAESLAFHQAVFNAESSVNRILFTFRVLSPSGAEVFTHTGNAAPGTPGQATARVSGIPIRRFWTGPGNYTLVAQASLDGNALEQRTTFGVFSPNVTLLYPSDGARELQPPLALRWVSSGSSRYRVLVDDDPSLYNTIFTGLTAGPENFFDYPDNPPNPLERLSGGQVYYWKVEGLDANGNKIAESGVSSFVLRNQASPLTRDLAVTGLELVTGDIQGAGAVPFRIKVMNRGGTTEPNVRVTLTVGGLEPPDSPKTIAVLSPGQEVELVIAALLPPEQPNTIAFATVMLLDDNPLNNYRQLPVARPGSAGPLAAPTTSQVTADRDEADRKKKDDDDKEFAAAGTRPIWAWKKLSKELSPTIRDKVRGYKPVGLDMAMDPDELKALLRALQTGQAHIVRAEVK